MKRRDYEVFYIFEILAAAKKGITKKKLRDSVSCNGVKYKIILDGLLDNELLQEASGVGQCMYWTSDIGRALLEQWNSILSILDLGDLLSQYI
jgi:predicted transcriptional regulator